MKVHEFVFGLFVISVPLVIQLLLCAIVIDSVLDVVPFPYNYDKLSWMFYVWIGLPISVNALGYFFYRRAISRGRKPAGCFGLFWLPIGVRHVWMGITEQSDSRGFEVIIPEDGKPGETELRSQKAVGKRNREKNGK